MAALGAAGLAPERRSARGCSQRCAGQEVPQHPGGTDGQVGARAVSPPAPAARTGGALRQGPWLASSARSGTGLLIGTAPADRLRERAKRGVRPEGLWVVQRGRIQNASYLSSPCSAQHWEPGEKWRERRNRVQGTELVQLPRLQPR